MGLFSAFDADSVLQMQSGAFAAGLSESISGSLALVVVVGVVGYAFLIMLTGARGARRHRRAFVQWMVKALVKLVVRATRFAVLGVVNTVVLVWRLSFSGSPAGRSEALAKFTERMADALVDEMKH